jgi:hypothetical protein
MRSIGTVNGFLEIIQFTNLIEIVSLQEIVVKFLKLFFIF